MQSESDQSAGEAVSQSELSCSSVPADKTLEADIAVGENGNSPMNETPQLVDFAQFQNMFATLMKTFSNANSSLDLEALKNPFLESQTKAAAMLQQLMLSQNLQLDSTALLLNPLFMKLFQTQLLNHSNTLHQSQVQTSTRKRASPEPNATSVPSGSTSENKIPPVEGPIGKSTDEDFKETYRTGSGKEPGISGDIKVIRKGGKEVAKFQCGDCSFVTSQLAVFNQHVATHKNNEKEHECEVCRQKFKYKQSVKKHMMKHQGITPYHCQVCDYKTNSHSSLEVHQRAHSGEKPFVCDSCGMRFAQNSQLRVHIQYHSNANNPYKCELCDYQSPNYYKLTRHMKVHRERPYACDLCNKRFMLPYQLRNHAATHLKSFPTGKTSPQEPVHILATCAGCDASFLDENMLNLHVQGCIKKSLKKQDAVASKKLKRSCETEVSADASDETTENGKSSVALTTEITHPNNKVSRILHIPSKTNLNSKAANQELETQRKLSEHNELSEHREDFLLHSQPKLNLPDDVVVIKPEAAPSDFSGGWSFGVDIPEDSKFHSSALSDCSSWTGKSEHSENTSSFVSPCVDNNEAVIADAEAIQSQMSSIFDKLVFSAESDLEHANNSALDLSTKCVPGESCNDILDLTVGGGHERLEELKEDVDDQKVWNLSKDQVYKCVDFPGAKGEPLEEKEGKIVKMLRVLPEEEAIIKTDNVERPFKCGYCGKQFIQSSHIRVHLQYHVNAGNPFRCADCSYTSASKYKLNLHVKVHRERRFQCEFCCSKFTLNCRLNQHMKLAHADNLPYKCTLCNVTFSSTNLLSWHVSNKHSAHGKRTNSTADDRPEPADDD